MKHQPQMATLPPSQCYIASLFMFVNNMHPKNLLQAITCTLHSTDGVLFQDIGSTNAGHDLKVAERKAAFSCHSSTHSRSFSCRTHILSWYRNVP